MKKFTFFLLLIVIVSFSFSSCIRRPARIRPVEIFYTEMAEEQEDIILENEYLSFRFTPYTTSFVLTDRATGMEWHSNPKGPGVDRWICPFTGDTRTATVVASNLMDSIFSLQYTDATGVPWTMFSALSSVNTNAFQFEVINDRTIEVSYTVGDLARVFRIPPAAPEDRMRTFLDRMSDGDRAFVLAAYRLFDINNLRSGDNRDELLAIFPDITRVNVFRLRETTQPFMKEMIEEMFREAGYTYEDFFEDSMRYPAVGELNQPAFNITIRYTLDGRSLVVSVPFDRIAFRPQFPFTHLTLLPFFGAGGINDEGYMLVPCGPGALIHFNNGRHSQEAFATNMFGWNEAAPRDAVIIDSRASFPAFGIHKNGHSLLAVIEEGASYASIRADVSGRNASFNRVHAVFELIHGAGMNVSGRTDRAVYLFQNGLPEGESITMRFTPTEAPGYVGMAQEFRSWMLDRYPAFRERQPVAARTPIVVEVIGAVNRTRHRLGIPFDLPLPLTTYKEVASMLNDFSEMGWSDVIVNFNGWFNHSVEHSVPTRLRLIDELGSRRDFQYMLETANRHNFEIFPEVDFFFIRHVRPFDGFNLNRHAVRYVNRERVARFPFSFVWFGERTNWGPLTFIANPNKMTSMVDNFIPRAQNLGIRNLSMRSIGQHLAGDYHERRFVSREAAMSMRQDMLAQLNEKDMGILVRRGFVYSLPWADVVIDLALEDQFFGITDVSVPFFPMVLRGVVPFTGRAINLAEDYTLNLLRIIESGAGLHFSFMKESVAELQETRFRQFHANEYHKWIDEANYLYTKFNEEFGFLFDKAMTDHIIVARGRTITVYEDGTRVFVNTTNYPWNYNGMIIGAESHLLVRQGA